MSVKVRQRDRQNLRKQQVNLDISIAPYDEGGVKNYYWPLPCDANLVVRDSLITFIAKLIEEDKEKSSELLAVRIFFKWFLTEVLNWYEASFLARQFKEDEMICDSNNGIEHLEQDVEFTGFSCRQFLHIIKFLGIRN